MNRSEVLREDQMVAEALQNVGLLVSSSQELLRTRDRYPKAIPVLLEMLPKVKTYTMKEIIARALGVREAKGRAEPLLISEFEASLPDSGSEAESLRWAIANTFEILGGGRGISESLLQLLVDPRSGEARGMLSLALAKTKNRNAIPILLKMLDGNFRGFAAQGLGILRAEQAIPKLQMMAKGPGTAWERRQARTALKRLGVTDI
jgi:HEAT repeat protein